MIYVENKKRKPERLRKQYPTAEIIDLTSSASGEWRKLSPFYPHMNIPIPFSNGQVATCVEAVWQGLKVFAGQDVDMATFQNATMTNIKRTEHTHGKTIGHRKGVNGTEILPYYDARMLIYLPTYKYVLDNVPDVKRLINELKRMSAQKDIVLLDYNTNTEPRDISQPMSHAGLIKLYLEDKYPVYDPSVKSFSPEEIEQLREKKKQDKKPIETTNELTLF